jgi:hypothetical protein
VAATVELVDIGVTVGLELLLPKRGKSLFIGSISIMIKRLLAETLQISNALQVTIGLKVFKILNLRDYLVCRVEFVNQFVAD